MIVRLFLMIIKFLYERGPRATIVAFYMAIFISKNWVVLN
jgi:hypothetical protein